MRARFEIQLEKLNQGVTEMGALVEEALEHAIDALVHENREVAEKNIEFDREIDQKMKEIETLCLKLLLSQQPVAKDLRLISAVLKMVSDLERIGDQCADISEIVLTFPADSEKGLELKYIPLMADATRKMVTESVDAFVKKDLELAKAVCEYDDVVDDLFDSVRRNLITAIRENMENGEKIIDILMIAKYFERIGDHAVNVAKWVIFSITGERNGCGYIGHDEDMKGK